MHRCCCSRKSCSSHYRHRSGCPDLCCYTWSYSYDNARTQSTRAPFHRHVDAWWCHPRDSWKSQARGSWMVTPPTWMVISGLEAIIAAPVELAVVCGYALLAFDTDDQMLQSAAVCCLLQTWEKAHRRRPASRSRKFWRRAQVK
jgi:hypothetical protein